MPGTCSICKHEEYVHATSRIGGRELCLICLALAVEKDKINPYKLANDKWCHNFKLDNLQLVEDLARERNLISNE